MRKSKTWRALVASAMSLLLCMSMLIGTTFAWFTDSVTSANNKIVSGNLDIEFEYSIDMNNWNDIAPDTNVFKEDALWEPGYAEVVYLRVKNAGNLALQYTLGINVAEEIADVNKDGDSFNLSEYIEYGVVEDVTTAYAATERSRAIADAKANAAKLNKAFGDVYTLEQNGEQDVFALVVYMPETVGNEADHNGKDVPVIHLGIGAYATQLTYEKDSFDDQYDKDAIIAGSAAEAQAALDNAGPNTVIKLVSGVDYGTLYIRQNADAKEVDIAKIGRDAPGSEKYSNTTVSPSSVHPELPLTRLRSIRAWTTKPCGATFT